MTDLEGSLQDDAEKHKFYEWSRLGRLGHRFEFDCKPFYVKSLEELYSPDQHMEMDLFNHQTSAQNEIVRNRLAIIAKHGEYDDACKEELKKKNLESQKRNIKKNLFCKVPDWDISELKSGAAIVEKYGYLSGGIKSYRNTLSCKSPNSQNLRLNVNYQSELLEIEEDGIIGPDLFKKVADVAVWRLRTLHNCLLLKHHETFWIEVDTRIGSAGQEQFRFNKIEHTRNPIVSQFDILLEQSMITVDLLLGRPKVDPVTGVKKKGGDAVSFKIKKNASKLLFPDSVFYSF